MLKTFLIALFIFLSIAFVLQHYENATSNYFLSSDPESYLIASQRLYQENLTAHPTRPFFYPLLIGLPLLWSNTEGVLMGQFSVIQVYFAIALNFIFWSITVLLLYKTLILWQISKTWSKYICLIYAANVGTVFNNFQILTEPLFTLLLLAHIYSSSLWWKNKTRTHFFYAILWACLCAVVRPSLYFFDVLVLPILIIILFLKKVIGKRELLTSLLTIVCVLGIQHSLMQRTFGENKFSYITSMAFYFCTSAYAFHFWEAQSWEERTKLYTDESRKRNQLKESQNGRDGWQELSREANQDALFMLKNYKSALLATWGRNFISNSIAPTPDLQGLKNVRESWYHAISVKLARIISRIQNIFYSFGLFLLPIILWRIRRRVYLIYNGNLPFLEIYVWFLAAYIIVGNSFITFMQGDRYHIVVVPLTLLLMATTYRFFKKPLEDNLWL